MMMGEWNELRVTREAASGLYLDDEEGGEVLMPGKYVAGGTKVGQEVKVFVYQDSEDRPVATTETPMLVAGETGMLTVVGLHASAGAFLDWGLEKDLLLPYREQRREMSVGDRVMVTVYVDERSGRLAATMRGDEMMGRAEKTAVVERPPDMVGGAGVMAMAEQVLAELRAAGGVLAFDDKSAPEAIRERFGTSKKVFKQAIGGLYRQEWIEFPEGGGIRLVEKRRGRRGN